MLIVVRTEFENALFELVDNGFELGENRWRDCEVLDDGFYELRVEVYHCAGDVLGTLSGDFS